MRLGPPDERLARLQRQQFGVFARSQADALGVPVATVDNRVRRGRYRRLLPGVYADPGAVDGWGMRSIAAVLWAGGDAVLARGSAARLRGLPVPRAANGAIHLLVRDRCFRVPAGIVVHRTAHLPDAHRDAVGRVPVTSVGRTICDLAGDLGVPDLRRLVAAAVRDELTDATDLRSCLAAVGPVAGARRLRMLVAELSPLDAQCASVLETDYLRMSRRYGIEPTALNHPVRDARGRRRYLDVVYLPEHVWVELDSRRFHGTTLDRNDDADREEAICLTEPWGRPLRFTWGDVHDRPDEVAARVRDALTAARATHPTGS